MFHHFEEDAMNDNRRAYVASVAGRLISGSNISEIFDCGQLKNIPVFSNGGGSAGGNGNGEYTYTLISENGERQYLVFQPETEAPIDLTIVENNFKGYDHSSKCFFGGSVRGDSISLFDLENSSYSSYNIKKN
jgi:hypothetical protein